MVSIPSHRPYGLSRDYAFSRAAGRKVFLVACTKLVSKFVGVFQLIGEYFYTLFCCFGPGETDTYWLFLSLQQGLARRCPLHDDQREFGELRRVFGGPVFGSLVFGSGLSVFASFFYVHVCEGKRKSFCFRC